MNCQSIDPVDIGKRKKERKQENLNLMIESMPPLTQQQQQAVSTLLHKSLRKKLFFSKSQVMSSSFNQCSFVKQ